MTLPGREAESGEVDIGDFTKTVRNPDFYFG